MLALVAASVFGFGLAAARRVAKAFACDLVLFGRDAEFRAGKFLRRYVARARLIPETSGLLGRLTLVTKSFLPGIWLCFSFTYSRGSARDISD